MGGARSGNRNVEYWGNPEYRAIKTLRQLTDTTQSDLAAFCMTTPNEISCIERGVKVPRMATARMLSELFGLKPEYVMMSDGAFNAMLRSDVFRAEIKRNLKKPGQYFYEGNAYPKWEVKL